MNPIPQPASRGLRVDLGSADKCLPGFDKYLDLVAAPNIPKEKMVVADLRQKWPFEDSSVVHFRAYDIIEHLPDKIHTMNEAWRCLVPGGTIEIYVPTVDGVGSICDPQHVSLWSRASFDYFMKGDPAHTRLAGSYGISAAFDVVSEEKKIHKKSYRSGQEMIAHLLITLRANKPGMPAPPVEPAKTRTWSVVIPSNSAVRLRRAVQAVLKTHSRIEASWIVVIDDGARADWQPSDPNVTWVTGVKPFVYARNVNLGIAAIPPTDDVMLMGDDVEIVSSNGLYRLEELSKNPNVGIVSAGIRGPVSNSLQTYRPQGGAVDGGKTLAFVCVYINRACLTKVGNLDERFIGYGIEDRDYCLRATQLGFKLFVEQTVEAIHNAPGMESAWRNRPDLKVEHQRNITIFEQKWKNDSRNL